MEKRKINNPKQAENELKDLFTGYWAFLALRTACQLGIFDCLERRRMNGRATTTVEALCKELNLENKGGAALPALLAHLEAQGYISRQNQCLYATDKGKLLTSNHPSGLYHACLLWGGEHLTAWQHGDLALRRGKPSFEALYDRPYFDYLASKPDRLLEYHLAMSAYAAADYFELGERLDLSAHGSIADVGGGLGRLLDCIAPYTPQAQRILFDRPEVVALRAHLPYMQPPQPSREYLPKIQRLGFYHHNSLRVLSGSFFDPLPFQAHALFLARVLHDWNEGQALQILKNCKRALMPGGKLYVLEILKDQTPTPLLDLNMAFICGSQERSRDEYEALLKQAGFVVQETVPVNDLQQALVCGAK